MIPLELRLRNFMCYRDNVPPLAFDGIQLACLTGPNGHGKSALLDAITWALWGKARAKRDDELIHLGESEMEVEFTFDLGATVYRVIRKRDSTKRGRTLLDLQIQHGDEFRSVAGEGVRGTQDAIVRLLRMDYDTFTNSAFLLQGKADAFTTRTPAERKQVLGDILGLSLYDEYEQQAKDRARDRERQLVELDGTLREIDRDLARRPEYETEVSQAKAHVAELSAKVKESQVALQELRHRLQMLEHKSVQLQDLERRISRSEQELSEVEKQIETRQERLSEYKSILAERSRVEEGYADLVAVTQEDKRWNECLAAHVQLQERLRALERVVEAARRELELEQAGLAERVDELQRRAGEVPDLARELAEARARVAYLTQRQTEREEAQRQIQFLAESLAALEEENRHLRAQMEELAEKRELLQSESDEALCPLCRQVLSGEHRDKVIAQINAEGKALADAHRANAARREEVIAEAEQLRTKERELGSELSAFPAEQRREAQLEQALANAQEAAEQLRAAHAGRAAVDQRLASKAYALEEQQLLAELNAEAKELGYDEAAHDQVRSKIRLLAAFEEAYRKLQNAEDRIGEETVLLDELRVRQNRWRQSLIEDEAERKNLALEVSELAEVSEQVRQQAQVLEDLQVEASQGRLALGAAQQKLDHCTYLAQEKERRVVERNRVLEEKAVFDDLRLAFGKKGIQAMIIEAAIPEIEYEANNLLGRMTDGRMKVRFDTQRETLKGDTVETLDINIADELGTRPYELFSGGEAFRVNFAIRIALSKLLARRAGAQLQMLVIDEGFGTQDAQGRERLVEAINSIRSDFARILVITHLEELKDAFPVRIEVSKSSAGSQISLT